MSAIYLQRWVEEKLQRVKIDNINIDGKVCELKKVAREKVDVTNNTVFMYCGLILEDDNKTLCEYGIIPEASVNLLEKQPPKKDCPKKTLTEEEVQDLVARFRVFTPNSGFRSQLQRAIKSELFEKMKNAIPDLENDVTAMAILQDPELLLHMVDPEVVRSIGAKHPALIEGTKFLAKHMQDQAVISVNTPGTSTGYSYILDAMSDDEEMESDSNNREAFPLTRNTSYNAITAAQLAAAIANATNTAFNMNAAGVPAASGSGSNLITNEMFNSAMQAAFASSPSTPSRNEETLEAITRRLQPQLRQMREMGLSNDSVNVRALQATNADVQAAIELVFNGVID